VQRFRSKPVKDSSTKSVADQGFFNASEFRMLTSKFQGFPVEVSQVFKEKKFFCAQCEKKPGSAVASISFCRLPLREIRPAPRRVQSRKLLKPSNFMAIAVSKTGPIIPAERKNDGSSPLAEQSQKSS